MSAKVGFYCPNCSHYEVYTVPPSGRSVPCSSCGRSCPIDPSSSFLNGGPVDQCAHCGNREFYLRKDFPQQLGCLTVLVTIGVSSVAYALWDFTYALIVLVVAGLFDLLLYSRLDEVTVCYRCHCELRGFTPNPSHGPFDIHRAEEYEYGR